MKTPQDRRLEKMGVALKLAVRLLNTPSLATLEKGGVRTAEQVIRLANSCFPDGTIFPEWAVETPRPGIRMRWSGSQENVKLTIG